MDKLDLIYDMVKNTNGRVTKLQSSVDEKNKEQDNRLDEVEDKFTLGYAGKIIFSCVAGMGIIAGAIYSIGRVI